MDFLSPREPVNTWSHGLWLVLAVPGIWLLWYRARGDLGKQISLMVYGFTLVFCSACSTLFHGVRASDSQLKTFALLDHISIYMLIAGTYTPIAWTFLRSHWRRGVLGLVWFWAAMGISIHLLCVNLPPWLYTSYYLGMGWGALFCYFEVARWTSHRALFPIVSGGLLYSLGAIFNLLQAPVLWPGVFQSHELFHVFVVAGSLAHFYFMFAVVGPSEVSLGFSPPTGSEFSPLTVQSLRDARVICDRPLRVTPD